MRGAPADLSTSQQQCHWSLRCHLPHLVDWHLLYLQEPGPGLDPRLRRSDDRHRTRYLRVSRTDHRLRDFLKSTGSVAASRAAAESAGGVKGAELVLLTIRLFCCSYNIMKVLGNNLTLHSPSRGFSMELGRSFWARMPEPKLTSPSPTRRRCHHRHSSLPIWSPRVHHYVGRCFLRSVPAQRGWREVSPRRVLPPSSTADAPTPLQVHHRRDHGRRSVQWFVPDLRGSSAMPS